VYAAFLIAVAVYGLEQSMSWQHSEIQRAWGGIVGGIAGWVMVDVSIRMGMADIQRENGIFLWILAALVFYRLWKRVLPIGVRFWLGAFLLEWIGRVILAGQVYLAAWLPVFQVTYQLIGYGAMLAWAILLVWMFTRSRTRLTRLAGAVFMWFFATVILAFLQGGLV
jgi:hypothetical protein